MLKLKGPVGIETTDDILAPLSNPEYCHGCLNFSHSVVWALSEFRVDVKVGPNARWSTRTVDSCEFTSRATEVLSQARAGCPSCELLMKCISGAVGQDVEFDDPTLELSIIFLEGNVLRIFMQRVEEEVDSLGFGEASQGTTERVLEIYTLPGKI